MVGTNPIRRPSARVRSAHARMVAGVRSSSIRLPPGGFPGRWYRCRVRALRRIDGRQRLETVRRGWKHTATHIVRVGADRLAGGGPQVGIALREARRHPLAQTEHVVQDEDLPIAMDTGTDTDGRNAEP